MTDTRSCSGQPVGAVVLRSEIQATPNAEGRARDDIPPAQMVLVAHVARKCADRERLQPIRRLAAFNGHKSELVRRASDLIQ